MRSSSRTDILDAAVRVVNAAGGIDITYESVSREAGLTKAGLMYHFPTKDALMIGVIEHVVDRWKAELLGVLGRPLEESTLRERVHAFVIFASEGGVTQGEFTVFAEAVRRPLLAAPWLEYLKTWFGFEESDDDSGVLTAWLAANGLWIAEATGILTVSDAQRARLVASLEALIGQEAR